MFGNVTDLQQRSPPIKYTSSCGEDQGFPLKAKSFRNTVTYQKLKGGPPTPPPLPLLYHGGMTLRVRPRVNEYSSTSESNGRHLIPQLKTRGGAQRF